MSRSQVYAIRFPKDNLPNTKNVINVAIDAVLAAMTTNQLQKHRFILPLPYVALEQTVPTPRQYDAKSAMMNMKKLVKEALMEEFHATSLTAEPYVNILTAKRFLVEICKINAIDAGDLNPPQSVEEAWADHLKVPGEPLLVVLRSRFNQLYALKPMLAKKWIMEIVTPDMLSIIGQALKAQDEKWLGPRPLPLPLPLPNPPSLPQNTEPSVHGVVRSRFDIIIFLLVAVIAVYAVC